MKIYWLIILMATCIYTRVIGQTDSIIVTEETVSEEEFAGLIKAYNNITRVKKEETKIIKIDLLGPLLYVFANNDPGVDTIENNLVGIGYEQKINPNWSWGINTYVRASEIEVTKLEWELGARYYYNLKRRMLKGRSANNFSANYLSLAFNGQSDLVNKDFQGGIRTMIGIQRRIGKYGYVDWNIGLETIFLPFDNQKASTDTYTRITVGIGLNP